MTLETTLQALWYGPMVIFSAHMVYLAVQHLRGGHLEAAAPPELHPERVRAR